MDPTLESAARLVVVASCVSLLAAGLAVLARELLAGRPAPLERETGPLAAVNYAGIGLFVCLGIATAVTRVASIGGIAASVDAVARGTGIVTLWFAAGLAAWGIRTMGRNLVSPAEVRADTELITAGPFRIVRHPMYLSIVLLWAGGALALLNVALAIGAIVLIPAFVLRARVEERMLTRHFGDAYTAYAAGVPMLFPGIWRRGRARARAGSSRP